MWMPWSQEIKWNNQQQATCLNITCKRTKSNNKCRWRETSFSNRKTILIKPPCTTNNPWTSQAPRFTYWPDREIRNFGWIVPRSAGSLRNIKKEREQFISSSPTIQHPFFSPSSHWMERILNFSESLDATLLDKVVDALYGVNAADVWIYFI